MRFLLYLSSLALLALQLASGTVFAQTLTPLCSPLVTSQVVVASPAQRLAAGARAQPPLTDTFDGLTRLWA